MDEEKKNKRKFVKISLDEDVKKLKAPAREKKSAKKQRLFPEEKKISKELEQIYKNDDGTLPDMGDFEKSKSNRLISAFVILLLSCLFLGAVAWIGFFVFSPQSSFKEEGVTLSITGDEQAMAGSEARYRIYYRNNQNVPLAKSVLQVRYPEGFVFAGSSREAVNEKKDEWAVGSLDKGDSGYIDIEGRIYGNVGQKQSIRVFFNYFPANFSSEFQKVASLNVEINESPVDLKVSGPSEAALGVKTEFLVEINLQSPTTSNLVLLVESGGSFSISDSEPKADAGNQCQWTISELKENAKFVIRGFFQEDAVNNESKIVFKVLGWKDEKIDAEPYVFNTVEWPVKILKTDLSANLAINGAVSDISVEPGEALNASIILKNNGETALKNLQVKLILEMPSSKNLSILDWRQLNDISDGDVVGEQVNPQTRRGVITWDSRRIPALRQLASGKEANIDISIPIKDSTDTDLSQFTSYQGSAQAEITYQRESENKTLSSNLMKFIINSDLKFEVRDKISNSANKEEHAITWILSNSFHELKNIEVSADLYGDIAWQDAKLVVPAGKAEYNQAEKKLIWKIETMPVNVDVLALQFAIVLNTKNPSQTSLASKVKIKATDAITGQDIVKAGDEILLSQ